MVVVQQAKAAAAPRERASAASPAIWSSGARSTDGRVTSALYNLRSFGSLEDGVGLVCKKHKRPGDVTRQKLRETMRKLLGLEPVSRQW
jgi:hypothetical protein